MIRSSGTRGRLTARAAGVLAAAMLFAGCEGGNLFEGEVAEDGPSVAVTVQTSVESGQSFNVAVTATAPRGVRFIDVGVVGDPTGSQRRENEGNTATQTEVFTFTASSSSATMMIEAYAQDVNGRNSPTERRTIQVTSSTIGGAKSD